MQAADGMLLSSLGLSRLKPPEDIFKYLQISDGTEGYLRASVDICCSIGGVHANRIAYPEGLAAPPGIRKAWVSPPDLA